MDKLPLIVQPASAWNGDPSEIHDILHGMAVLPARASGLFWRVSFPNIRGIEWQGDAYLMLRPGRPPLASEDWPRVIGSGNAQTLKQALVGARIRLHGPKNNGAPPVAGLMVRRNSILAFHYDPQRVLLYFPEGLSGHEQLEEIERIMASHNELFGWPQDKAHA